jgi:uncharacterized protein YjbJ (UPF0337 family)
MKNEGGGRTDELKGRVKEAAGDLADDEDLKREGKLDRAAGRIKEGAKNAVDEAKKTIRGE